MPDAKKMLRSSIVGFLLATASLVALVGLDSGEVVDGLGPGVTGPIASLLVFVMALTAGGAVYAAIDLVAHRRASRKRFSDRKERS